VQANIARAREMGITEEELAEAIHVAASVGSGSILAMAARNSKASEPKKEELPTDTKPLSKYMWKRR
jgi:alkylhydroperoxidase/carboxymuconolactone decarboxylase family protein YurZ